MTEQGPGEWAPGLEQGSGQVPVQGLVQALVQGPVQEQGSAQVRVLVRRSRQRRLQSHHRLPLPSPSRDKVAGWVWRLWAGS
ncbi:MAG: hypothetical protein ABI574_19685 [Burkholderiales bacterium]